MNAFFQHHYLGRIVRAWLCDAIEENPKKQFDGEDACNRLLRAYSPLQLEQLERMLVHTLLLHILEFDSFEAAFDAFIEQDVLIVNNINPDSPLSVFVVAAQCAIHMSHCKQ